MSERGNVSEEVSASPADRGGRVTRLRPVNAIIGAGGGWACLVPAIPFALSLLLGVRGAPLWGVAGATSAATFAWAAYRIRLEVDEEEIRVFNVLSTHRVRWDAIRKIDGVGWWLSPSALHVGNSAVRVSTQDGRRVVIDASTRVEPEVIRVLSQYQGHRAGIEWGWSGLD